MTGPIYDGYDGLTYPGRKRCARCLRFNDNPEYALCDTCRNGDILTEYFTDDEGLIEAARKIREEDELWRDEQLTREINRP
jgi:hypothetical protein